MSQYSIEVDQYISNILQPEIDRLNVSLASMEEVGHSSTATKDTINKLNALAVIYDFLYEYALGSEEIDKSVLDSIMTQFGDHQALLEGVDAVAALRSSDIANTTRNLYPSIRIYLDEKLLTTTTILSSLDQRSFRIFGDNNTESIDVTIKIPGQSDVALSGSNYVIATGIIISEVEYMSIDVLTKAADGSILYSDTIDYEVISCGIDGLTYWVGVTNERFSINATDIDETTDITIDPNAGTGTGPVLDFNWLMLNFEAANEFIYTGTLQQRVITVNGNSHVLIVVPSTLYTSNLVEEVVGADVPLTDGLHYDSFSIFNGPTEYVITYLRDITDFTFQTTRDFGFTLDAV